MSEPACRRYDRPPQREQVKATHEWIVHAAYAVLAASSLGEIEHLPILVP